MANNDDWVEVPLAKAGADDWQEVTEPTLGDKAKDAGLAGLEHFGNATAMGYLPQIQAVTEKPMTKVLDAITGQDVSKDLPDYVNRRDENLRRLKQEEKEHPVASLAGTISGTVASAIPTGAALSKVPVLAEFAGAAAPEGASLLARVPALAQRTAASSAAAALQGAAANPGDVEGEVSPLQLKERAKNAGFSAAVAAPLHMAGEGVSSVADYIANRAKEKANQLAFRALGPYKRQVNQNRDQIQQIGREALDSGVVRKMPTNAAGLEERAEEAAGVTGKKLGDLTDELTKLEGEASSSGMTRKQVADNLRAKLLTENPQGIPGIDKKNSFFEDMISDFEKDPKIKQLAMKQNIPYEDALALATKQGYQPKPLSFSDLRQAKMNVQGTKDTEGLINWNRLKNADIPPEEQFHRALAGELRKGEESGAEAIEKAYYGQSSNRMKTLKDQFKNREAAAQIAGNKADAQRANQILGLKDAIYGGAGGTIGSILGHQLDDRGSYENAKMGAAFGSALGALGSKAARDYGPQVSAVSMDRLSKLAGKSKVIETILKRNPTLIPQLLQEFEREHQRENK